MSIRAIDCHAKLRLLCTQSARFDSEGQHQAPVDGRLYPTCAETSSGAQTNLLENLPLRDSAGFRLLASLGVETSPLLI